MYLICVAGGSGSGKSTFANKITSQFSPEEVLHMYQDWYYLHETPEDQYIKGKPNFDHPDAFDWQLLVKHLSDLKMGRTIEAPVYDFVANGRRAETKRIKPAKVAILEGIYSLWHPEIIQMADLKVFLTVEADIRFIRRLHRDVKERGRTLDSVINQYYDTVRPMHRQFLEPTSQYADILVGEETDTAAMVISEKVRAILKE